MPSQFLNGITADVVGPTFGTSVGLRGQLVGHVLTPPVFVHRADTTLALAVITFPDTNGPELSTPGGRRLMSRAHVLVRKPHTRRWQRLIWVVERRQDVQPPAILAQEVVTTRTTTLGAVNAPGRRAPPPGR